MRKICFILMIAMVCMTFASFIPAGAQGTEVNVNDEAAALLAELGIMGIPEEADEYLEDVTRADFALYAAIMLGVDAYAVSTTRYYTDVPVDHWGLGAINALTEMGILNGYMGKFRPSDIITMEEAVKILSCVLGYVESEQAPESVIRAVRNDLVEGTDGYGTVQLFEAIQLIYNALNTEVLSTYLIGDGYFRADTDEILMESLYDISVIEGVVTEVYGVSADGEPRGDINSVRIEKERFECDMDENLNRYLGRYVRAYYHTDKNDVRELRLMFPQKSENKEVIINADNFNNFSLSSGALSYYDEARGKSYSVSVPKNAVVIKNGEDVTAKTAESLANLKKGTIEVVSSDNYSVIIIREYTNVVPGHISVDTKKVYDKYVSERIIDLQDGDEKYVGIWNEEGKRITVEEITADKILSVYASEKYIDVYVTGKSAVGVIEKMSDAGGRKIVTINSVEYEIDEALMESDRGKAIKIGQSVTLYLDMFGKVANVSEVSADGMLFGYIIDAVVTDNGLEQELKVKLLTQNNERKAFECAEKIRIDGVLKTGGAEQSAALSVSNGSPKHQVVRYKVNGDGVLSEIDTTYISERETSENSLSVAAAKADCHYDSRAMNLGRYIIMDADTAFFGVPSEDKIADADEKDFLKVLKSDMISGTTYHAEAYKVGTESGAADVIIIFDAFSNSTGKAQLSLFVAEENIQGYDEERGDIEIVSGMAEGVKKEFVIAEEFSSATMKPGDLFRLSLNENDEITMATEYYDFETKTKTRAGNWKNWDIEGGYVLNIRDNIMTLSTTPNGAINQLANITGVPITVYDTRGQKPVCRVGSVADIVEAKNTGALVYIFRRWVAPVSLVVYL